MQKKDFNTMLGNVNRMINERNRADNQGGDEYAERPLNIISTEKAAARGTLVTLKAAGMIV